MCSDQKDIRKYPADVVGVFFFAIVVYLLFALIDGHEFYTPSPDGDLYINLAQNFVSGNGLVNTVRNYEIVPPPVFSLVIALFLYFFNNVSYFIVFNYLLHGASAIMVLLISIELFDSKWVGLTAVFLFSFYPALRVFGPRYALMETMYTFLLLMTLYFFLRFMSGFELGKTTNPIYGVLVIFFLVISVLIRPHLMVLIPLFILGFAYLVFVEKLSWKWMVYIVIIPTILIGGNVLYNYKIHGQFIMFSNYSGTVLYYGNNPNTPTDLTYSSNRLDKFVEPFYFTLEDKTLSEQNAILGKRAREYIVAHPYQAVERTVNKIIYLFFAPLNRYDNFLTVTFLLGAALSLMVLDDRRVAIFCVFILIIFYAGLTSIGIIVDNKRYQLPIIPVYILFSAFFIVYIFDLIIALFKRQVAAI